MGTERSGSGDPSRRLALLRGMSPDHGLALGPGRVRDGIEILVGSREAAAE